MVLEVDGELVPKHNVYDWHEFAVDGDCHISYSERTFGVVEFRFWHSIAKHAVGILLVLVRGYITPLRASLWRGNILALWWGTIRILWLVRWWCLACRHRRSTHATKLYSVGYLVSTPWTSHELTSCKLITFCRPCNLFFSNTEQTEALYFS